MSRKSYLIVVRAEEDKHDVFELLKTLVSREDVSRSATGVDARFWLKNGIEYTVWSIEQWSEALTCGATFDAVMNLTHPVPKFVTESLYPCMRVQRAAEETAREGKK